jgi:hypothetical protein
MALRTRHVRRKASARCWGGHVSQQAGDFGPLALFVPRAGQYSVTHSAGYALCWCPSKSRATVGHPPHQQIVSGPMSAQEASGHVATERMFVARSIAAKRQGRESGGSCVLAGGALSTHACSVRRSGGGLSTQCVRCSGGGGQCARMQRPVLVALIARAEVTMARVTVGADTIYTTRMPAPPCRALCSGADSYCPLELSGITQTWPYSSPA